MHLHHYMRYVRYMLYVRYMRGMRYMPTRARLQRSRHGRHAARCTHEQHPLQSAPSRARSRHPPRSRYFPALAFAALARACGRLELYLAGGRGAQERCLQQRRVSGE